MSRLRPRPSPSAADREDSRVPMILVPTGTAQDRPGRRRSMRTSKVIVHCSEAFRSPHSTRSVLGAITPRLASSSAQSASVRGVVAPVSWSGAARTMESATQLRAQIETNASRLSVMRALSAVPERIPESARLLAVTV